MVAKQIGDSFRSVRPPSVAPGNQAEIVAHEVSGTIEMAVAGSVLEAAKLSRNIQEALYQEAEAFFAGIDKLASAKSLNEAVQIQSDMVRARGKLFMSRAKASTEYLGMFIPDSVNPRDPSISAGVNPHGYFVAATSPKRVDTVSGDAVLAATSEDDEADWQQVWDEVLKLLGAELLDTPASHLAYVRDRLKPVFDHGPVES